MRPGRFWVLVVALAGVASMGGCAEDQMDAFDSVRVHRQEIRGGQTDSEHTSVVGVYVENGWAAGICTGTLIAPNLVLTARHCVAELDSEYVECGVTEFGPTFSARGVLVTAETTFSQDYRDYDSVREVRTASSAKEVCGNDIALLILRSNMSSSRAQPIIPRVDLGVVANERYTAVGYGHTGRQGTEGVRRILAGREVMCVGRHCPGYTSVQDSEFMGSDGTCQGDSGGPALDSRGRVVGALSRGPDGCQGSLYSSVFSWASWLRDVGSDAATLGNYDEPDWVAYGTSDPPRDDPDGDGVRDATDNCPQTRNPDQADLDRDGIGDACDTDIDGDGTANASDNCSDQENPDQGDIDRDGQGDVCDWDMDGDSVANTDDNCPRVPNEDQLDTNQDQAGDACQDIDSDPDDPDAGREDADDQEVGPERPAHCWVDENGYVDCGEKQRKESCSAIPGAPSGAPTLGVIALLVTMGLVSVRLRR